MKAKLVMPIVVRLRMFKTPNARAEARRAKRVQHGPERSSRRRLRHVVRPLNHVMKSPSVPALTSAKTRQQARHKSNGRNNSPNPDPKSTRLNSSHLGISYAVFC